MRSDRRLDGGFRQTICKLRDLASCSLSVAQAWAFKKHDSRCALHDPNRNVWGGSERHVVRLGNYHSRCLELLGCWARNTELKNTVSAEVESEMEVQLERRSSRGMMASDLRPVMALCRRSISERIRQSPVAEYVFASCVTKTSHNLLPWPTQGWMHQVVADRPGA